MNRYKEWIKRAKYNYKLAVIEIDEDTVLEELCYNAQQAVEKAFKGLIIYYGQEHPLTHNIGVLLNEIEKHTDISDEIMKSVSLTPYPHQTRYPGDYVDIPLEAYKDAVTIAKKCLDWVDCKIIKG